MAEAKRLWELEADKPSITTIHASIVLDTIHSMCGLDTIGKKYLHHGIRLAHEMRLLEGPPPRLSKRERTGWAFTAWVLYSLDA
jgi:hypothetical protein